ncbi:MAG: hypothetical protein AAB250_07575, partial [Bdellovibrionota bacterium]
AFQYELEIRPEDQVAIKKIIDEFRPSDAKKNSYVSGWLEKNASKLVRHAVDIELAWNELERLGLRKKLIAVHGDAEKIESMAWWLSKEPVRSSPVGLGRGKTAAQLGIDVVAHETNSYLSMESIARSHTGEPNVFASRQDAKGETAAYGWGFYTARGRKGMAGTGLTLRFNVDPDAREGTDFVIFPKSEIVLFRNKQALSVIHEDLKLGPLEYLNLVQTIDRSDRGILEKLARRISLKSNTISETERDVIRELISSRNLPDKEQNAKYASQYDQAPRDPVLGAWLKLSLADQSHDVLLALIDRDYHIRQIIEEYIAVKPVSVVAKLVDRVIERGSVNGLRQLLDSMKEAPSFKDHPRTAEWLRNLIFERGNYLALVVHMPSVKPGRDEDVVEKIVREQPAILEIARILSRPEWSSHPRFGEFVGIYMRSPSSGMGIRSYLAVADLSLESAKVLAERIEVALRTKSAAKSANRTDFMVALEILSARYPKAISVRCEILFY